MLYVIIIRKRHCLVEITVFQENKFCTLKLILHTKQTLIFFSNKTEEMLKLAKVFWELDFTTTASQEFWYLIVVANFTRDHYVRTSTRSRRNVSSVWVIETCSPYSLFTTLSLSFVHVLIISDEACYKNANIKHP